VEVTRKEAKAATPCQNHRIVLLFSRDYRVLKGRGSSTDPSPSTRSCRSNNLDTVELALSLVVKDL
jgi:hypothetical protein